MNSPITTTLGILTAVATVLQQALNENGIPQNAHQWFVLAMGATTSLGLLFAKDFNKTNSQYPNANAQTVPPVSSVAGQAPNIVKE